MAAQHLRVLIDIGYDDFLSYYEGAVKDVIAPDLKGRKVRFPVNALQPYLTHSGVSGIFELQINADNKLLSCKRISDIS